MLQNINIVLGMDLQYKTMLHFLQRRLCNKAKGYKCTKLERAKDRSYYFTRDFFVPIRFSNHYLHTKQERHRLIDVVIIDIQNSTVNKKPIIFPKDYKIKRFKKICLEYILLENHLYKISKRK